MFGGTKGEKPVVRLLGRNEHTPFEVDKIYDSQIYTQPGRITWGRTPGL